MNRFNPKGIERVNHTEIQATDTSSSASQTWANQSYYSCQD